MTKNSIFLMLPDKDTQKNFSTLPHLDKKLFFQDTEAKFFIFLFRKLKQKLFFYFIFLEAEAQVKKFYFFRASWKKQFLLILDSGIIFLSRIRLWKYFLMVKNFFYQLIPAQKYFLDGKMIFLNFRTSVLQQSCKNFESQEVL